MALGRRSHEAAAVAMSANLPVILWGAPGTGKTSSVLALGQAMGLHVEVVIGSIREPSDFSGLPVLRESSTRYAPPRWAQRLAEEGAGLLFLDELTTAPPAVQAAMLRVILERTVGDLVLPPGVRIMAAANPPEEAADGWDLSAPLANRMIHLSWEVDAEAIADGFVSGFAGPRNITTEPPPASEAGQARALVGTFLRVRPGLVLAVPKSPTEAGRAWPSPRTWSMAAAALAACRHAGIDDAVLVELLVGAVGEAAAYELLSWLRSLDLPAPEELLANPATALPNRIDRIHAALSSLVAYVIADGGRQSWEQAWAVIANVAKTAPDVAANAARSLAARRPEGCALPTSMLTLAPILRAAGLMR